MLVDGNFDIKKSSVIKNEDVIALYLIVLQKSSESLHHHGLEVFQQLLRDSISNRSSCVRAGMLDSLLHWFFHEDHDHIWEGYTYCECFAAVIYCDNCSCLNCLNNVENKTGRRDAVALTIEGNPDAFRTKLLAVYANPTLRGFVLMCSDEEIV